MQGVQICRCLCVKDCVTLFELHKSCRGKVSPLWHENLERFVNGVCRMRDGISYMSNYYRGKKSR